MQKIFRETTQFKKSQIIFVIHELRGSFATLLNYKIIGYKIQQIKRKHEIEENRKKDFRGIPRL